MKRGRDDPRRMTAREVLEDIAAFPLSKDFETDERGEIKHCSSSHGPSYAAYRNQHFAQQWLAANPERKRRQKTAEQRD